MLVMQVTRMVEVEAGEEVVYRFVHLSNTETPHPHPHLRCNDIGKYMLSGDSFHHYHHL